MLSSVGAHVERWLGAAPWNNAFGLGRTLLAVGTLLTLVSSSTETLFRPAFTLPPAPYCAGPSLITIFCLVPRDQLAVAQLISIGILVVVASGWRPRITAIPHWWVSFGLAGTMTIPDGGDQVTAVLTLLLIPVALTDPRRWHWSAPPRASEHALPAVIGLSALVVIRVQVAGIYFHSSVAKLGVTEWVDGTALYYWLNDPGFGPALWLREPLVGLARTGIGAVAMTWGPIALEMLLAIAILLNRRWWRALLPLGIAFHGGIAVMMGLVSFALAMSGALLLYLRALDRPFSAPVWARTRSIRTAAVRGRVGLAEPAQD